LIPDHIIDAVKSAANLPMVASSYGIHLHRCAGGYRALCCFHKERTPSLIIHTAGKYANSWKCFGCGAGSGSAIGFVQQIENISFPEAVRLLASRYGVSLDPHKPVPRAAQHAAREDAAISAWWWARRRQSVIDATCVAFNDEDEEFAECCGRLRRWIEAMSPADRVNQWLCHGTAAERREYRQEMADKEAWVAEMRGMWVAALAEDSAA